MFIIFENFTIEDVPEEITTDIIEELNSDSASYNEMFLKILSFLEELLVEFKNSNTIIANSNIDYILAFEFSAKSVQLVIKHKKHLIKIEPSEVERLKLNTSSIINAVESISKIQAERLKDLEPDELLVALTT